jgi:glyoxylase-like metal-dependent hydrolase (beta-lactamase superfamily II)
MNWFKIESIGPGAWHISEPIGAVEPRFGVATANMFLVAGSERAALIDTGMGIGDLRAVVQSLTRLPVIVCNTHWHWDHIGSNSQFDEIAIHAREFKLLTREQDVAGIREQIGRPEVQAILPFGFDRAKYRIVTKPGTRSLSHGDLIELGGRSLRVVQTPGHSGGHVSYFDGLHGLLFSGDTAYAGPMYACFKGGDPVAFQASAHRLAELANDVRLIAPGHNGVLQGGAFLQELADAADRAQSGDAPALPPDEFIGGREVRFDRFSIWLPKDS